MKIKQICTFFALFVCTKAFATAQLIFAVDLIRHGDRTPIDEIPKAPYNWETGLGELIQQGKDQLYQLGLNLRKKYIEQYHLLPAEYDADTLYVRSTAMERTVDSAESLLLGLYPKQSRPLSNKVIPVQTVAKDDDNLLVVKPTKNIFSLANLYIDNWKTWREKTATMQNKLDAWSEATGLDINSFATLDKVSDNFYVRTLHKVSLPQGISTEDANEIMAFGKWSTINKYKQDDVTYPMGHEFLTTVVRYMKEASQDRTDLKYVLFSGHDSSIMSVMNTLDAPLDNIPGYASRLNFSLFRNGNSYYVIVSLNNKPVNIPGCGGDICSLAQFIKAAS